MIDANLARGHSARAGPATMPANHSKDARAKGLLESGKHTVGRTNTNFSPITKRIVNRPAKPLTIAKVR
jgi:hypothetical protein